MPVADNPSVKVVECIAETIETASGGITSFAEMGVVVANAAIGEANRGDRQA